MPSESITFVTEGGHDLAGTLELPEGEVQGAAVYAHCFTCTRQSKAAVAVCRALARRGFAALRFDFTGLGESGGAFGAAGFAQDVADVVAAAEAMHARFGTRLLLVGHSLGGAAVLGAARKIGEDRVAAIATIGAPADVPHVLGNIKGDLDAIDRQGEGRVTIGGREFVLDKEFLERTREADLLAAVKQMREPLMICHSPTDDVVGVENASMLFEAAMHPKSFLSLDKADHLLLEEKDADFVASVIAPWALRYV